MTHLTCIVPATNQPSTLPRCLEAIARSTMPPEQLVVVDDPSLRHPALARNAGAKEARGEVLVFVDADVTVHPDAFARIRRAFDNDPDLDALFGSYDAMPDSPGVVSTFRNLLHHHVHQRGAGPASTFWAGLGAMRRDIFVAHGGFAVHPIEDIELGMRLAGEGATIRLDPTVQGTHLKHWTLYGMLRTDLLVRGMPWVGLLLKHRDSAAATSLNLGWQHRISALTSLVLVFAVVLRHVVLAMAALALLVILNVEFYRFLLRRQGPPRAAAGVGLHVLHHLVSITAVPLGILAHLMRGHTPPEPEG